MIIHIIPIHHVVVLTFIFAVIIQADRPIIKIFLFSFQLTIKFTFHKIFRNQVISNIMISQPVIFFFTSNCRGAKVAFKITFNPKASYFEPSSFNPIRNNVIDLSDIAVCIPKFEAFRDVPSSREFKVRVHAAEFTEAQLCNHLFS